MKSFGKNDVLQGTYTTSIANINIYSIIIRKH